MVKRGAPATASRATGKEKPGRTGRTCVPKPKRRRSSFRAFEMRSSLTDRSVACERPPPVNSAVVRGWIYAGQGQVNSTPPSPHP
jgi:hypothetical protein